MHNFGSLYKTELKKILSKREVWITLVIGMALLIIAGISNILPFWIGGRYDFPDGTSMSAYEFYQQQKKTSEEITGQKLDDALLQRMRTEMKEFLKDKQDLPYAETTGSKEYRGIWFAAEKLGYEDLFYKCLHMYLFISPYCDFSTTANVYAHLDYNAKLSSASAMENGLGNALKAFHGHEEEAAG